MFLRFPVELSEVLVFHDLRLCQIKIGGKVAYMIRPAVVTIVGLTLSLMMWSGLSLIVVAFVVGYYAREVWRRSCVEPARTRIILAGLCGLSFSLCATVPTCMLAFALALLGFPFQVAPGMGGSDRVADATGYAFYAMGPAMLCVFLGAILLVVHDILLRKLGESNKHSLLI